MVVRSMFQLLGNLEGTGCRSCQVASAQNADGHHIAARLGGRRGAGVQLPAGGESGVQVVHTALVHRHVPIIGQGCAEIEGLGLLSGELACDLLVPDELGAAQTHLHQQEADAHAGLIVLAVGDSGHGVQAGPVGGTKGDAHAVQDTGHLVDDLQNLAEGSGVDTQSMEGIQHPLGAEQLPPARPL